MSIINLYAIVLFLASIYFFNGTKRRWILIFLFLILIIPFYLFVNRTLIISASSSIFYLITTDCLSNFKRKLLNWLSVGIIVLLLTFLYKLDSSFGRYLIYKITVLQTTKHELICGLGIGKFKARYNQMQASYFKENGLDTQNAILADNGYYLFNDWLQALLEIGLIGVVLLALLTLLFRKLYRYEANTNRWLFAANTTLVFISVSALFNYPLQTPIILFYFIICVIIHCYILINLELLLIISNLK